MQLTKGNRWYQFDDSHVSPINDDSLRTPAAYVLFYRRVYGSDTLMHDVDTLSGEPSSSWVNGQPSS